MAEAFDTHSAYQQLREGDRFSDDQAEVLVQLVNGAITGNLATKSDIASLKNDIDNLRDSTKSDMDSMRRDVTNEMKLQEHRIKLWIVSAIGVGVGLVKALDYLLPSIGL